MSASKLENYIYFDHNATTPMLHEVWEHVIELGANNWGLNASSVHAYGKYAKSLIDAARQKVLTAANVPDFSCIFTSGGTEGNNLAIEGLKKQGYVVLSSGIEHISVLNLVRNEAVLPVCNNGMVKLVELDSILKKYTDTHKKVAISVMIANNEVGVIQPIEEISAIAKKYNVVVHTDASQALGKVKIGNGADIITLSAHKIGGPAGVGALLLRTGIELSPMMQGGGQEYRMRPGTQNVLGISGFGVACNSIDLTRYNKLASIRDRIEGEVAEYEPQVIKFCSGVERLPNTLSITMPGVNAETQIIHFDLNGIAVSAGSACSSGKVELPHVHLAMGYAEQQAKCAIRISLGHENTMDEAAKFVDAWKMLYDNVKKKVDKI
jgi:cysteine desulfurase